MEKARKEKEFEEEPYKRFPPPKKEDVEQILQDNPKLKVQFYKFSHVRTIAWRSVVT